MGPRAGAVRDPGVRGRRPDARPRPTTTAPTRSSSTRPRPGSGQVFDWSLAEGAPDGRRVILAGGLTPDNVADAIAAGCSPWGVDVVDRRRGDAPGHKDPRKVQAFIDAATAARRADPSAPTHGDLDGRCPYDWMDDEVTATESPTAPPAAWASPTRRRAGSASSAAGSCPRRSMPALRRARGARSATAWADPAFRAELDDLLRDYAGRPSPLTECQRLVRASSACACCSSARTSTTPARTRSTTCSARPCSPERMGKTPARRRDRRRPARRRHRHRGGAARAWSASSTWARSTWSARRSTCSACGCSAPRSAGAVGQPHAEGRGQRGDARLGRHRRDHALLPRLGDGPAPVPVDGPRAPPGDRRRGPRAVPGAARRRRPRRRRRLRRRRLERGRHLLRLRRHRRPSWSASSRPAARRSATACPASCTA